jgi:hypothetical protein
MTDFTAALNAYVEGANRLLDEGINRTQPASLYKKKIGVQEGRVYVRLVMMENDHVQSAFGFIDKSNGNLLKSASWKTPAKNFARGNIFNPDQGLKNFHWTGVR